MLCWLAIVAEAAAPPAPWYGGIVSISRANAPWDGRIIVATNVAIAPELVADDEDPIPLATAVLLEGNVPDEGRIAILPPQGGWPVGARLTVTAPGIAPSTETSSLLFNAVQTPSPRASQPPVVVGEPAPGPWLSGNVPEGCCGVFREVAVVLAVASDPWSVLQLSTVEGEIEPVDVEILGDGTGTLTWTEWRWDGEETLHDSCVAAFHIGAAGDSSAGVTVCSEPKPSGDPTGCSTTAGTGWAALLALALLRRRR